ncbi:hypothetical protein GCM10018783_04170 [Streptomyces griseosporeus]|nr:hypothetical protein GCM10018783_04170 [Streptomyces griseosporeus]
MRALAADDRAPRRVHLVQIQHVRPGHRDTSGTALAFRALAFHNRLAPVDRLPSDNCLPSDETDGALARPPHVDNSTGTRALISAGCGLGGRFCAVTGALPQAPLAAIR